MDEDLSAAIGKVLFNVSNWPREVQAHAWGMDFSEFRDKLVAAVEPLLNRAKTEAWDEGAESAYYDPEYRDQVNYPDNPYREER